MPRFPEAKGLFFRADSAPGTRRRRVRGTDAAENTTCDERGTAALYTRMPYLGTAHAERSRKRILRRLSVCGSCAVIVPPIWSRWENP